MQNRRQLLPFGLEWADMAAFLGQTAAENKYVLPVSAKPSSHELKRINHFLSLCAHMKNSPFYSATLAAASAKDSLVVEELEGGVNDGIKRYSDKYRKTIKIGKSVSDHPFQLSNFPNELQGVIKPRGYKKGKKNALNVATGTAKGSYGDLEKNLDELLKKEMLDRLEDIVAADMDTGAANGNAGGDDDVDADQEDAVDDDDAFDDEDDDDYNAEKYFDDGDDDGYGDDDGGDDEAAF